MRRALVVAVSLLAVSCSDDERARGVPSTPIDSSVDTGLPIVEAGTDTGVGNDATTDSDMPVDSNVPDAPDTAPLEDATFSDIPSTKDTEIDAIYLEVSSDAGTDTALPDAIGFFDTAVEDVDAR